MKIVTITNYKGEIDILEKMGRGYETAVKAADYCINNNIEPYCGENGRLFKGHLYYFAFYRVSAYETGNVVRTIDSIISCYEGINPEGKEIYPLNESDTLENRIAEVKEIRKQYE